MAIGSVIERGGYVYIYDEKGSQLANVAIGTGTDHVFLGYTTTRISIRRGTYIYLYDEKGRQVGNIPV